MPRNGIQDLRNHLFETLEALKDEEKPMDIERAGAICKVAEKLIDTARVEVKFLEVTGNRDEGKGFFKPGLPEVQPKPNSDVRRLA
jgi:hypothetical protein